MFQLCIVYALACFGVFYVWYGFVDPQCIAMMYFLHFLNSLTRNRVETPSFCVSQFRSLIWNRSWELREWVVLRLPWLLPATVHVTIVGLPPFQAILIHPNSIFHLFRVCHHSCGSIMSTCRLIFDLCVHMSWCLKNNDRLLYMICNIFNLAHYPFCGYRICYRCFVSYEKAMLKSSLNAAPLKASKPIQQMPWMVVREGTFWIFWIEILFVERESE